MLINGPTIDDDDKQALTRRGEIHLGDLATALSKLAGATSAEQELIANCLGFKLEAPAVLAEPKHKAVKAAWNRPLLKQQSQAHSKLPGFSPTIISPPVAETINTSSNDLVQAELSVTTVELPHSPNYQTPPSSDGILFPESANPPMPRQSLFPHQTARGLISATVTRQVPGSDIDTRKLINSLVQQKPLKKFPVLPQATVRNGCQLLLDFNDALMPWWDDMHSLISQFHRVLGAGLCPVYEFSDNPVQAIRWTENGEQPWQANPNQPVIIATDLGLIQAPIAQRFRPGKSEWLEFIASCKQQKTPVIILFPLHPQRCPYNLDKLATLIHWHPATSSAMIKRLIRQTGNRK